MKREKGIVAASLTTDEPFFCIAGAGARRTACGPRVSRRSPCRPMTISQPTRIAMSRCSGPKTGSTGRLARAPLDILRPFPKNSFSIMPPIQQNFDEMLGAA
ncbi:MAG: hypothetical protein Q8Q79_12590 [Sphingopyxis sp.]|nr:hypothetical protein [Sphingopyxis sp.]